MKENIKFEVLKGKVLAKVENKENEELIFTTVDGAVYKLYHCQDCCESVTIEDICGDLDDLIGEPLIVVEEVENEQGISPESVTEQEYHESFTWTFYKLDTCKGGVTVRWYGGSNGHYCKSVDFCRVT